jgi:hypothetical protein
MFSRNSNFPQGVFAQLNFIVGSLLLNFDFKSECVSDDEDLHPLVTP